MSAPADGAARNICGRDVLAAGADASVRLNLPVVFSTNTFNGRATILRAPRALTYVSVCQYNNRQESQ